MASGRGIEKLSFNQLLKFVFRVVKKGLRKYRKPTIEYDDAIMPWTIIQTNLSVKDYNGRVKRFHGHFKYVFLIPLLWFGYWLLRKFIVTREKIPDEGQNELILLVSDTFDVTVKEWCKYYRRMDVSTDDYLKNTSTDALLKIRDLVVTGYMHDAAYRPLIDMFICNLTVAMGKKYPGKIGGFIYNSKNIDDLDFKIVTGRSTEHLVFNVGDHKLAVKKGDAIRVENVDMRVEKTK